MWVNNDEIHHFPLNTVHTTELLRPPPEEVQIPCAPCDGLYDYQTKLKGSIKSTHQKGSLVIQIIVNSAAK